MTEDEIIENDDRWDTGKLGREEEFARRVTLTPEQERSIDEAVLNSTSAKNDRYVLTHLYLRYQGEFEYDDCGNQRLVIGDWGIVEITDSDDTFVRFEIHHLTDENPPVMCFSSESLLETLRFLMDERTSL